MENMASAPGISTADIVLSDSVNLARASRGLYIGVGGNLKVTMVGGMTATFINLGSGTILPICITRAWLNGTTCTNLISLY